MEHHRGLAAEFFAGAGASDKLRTLFAVGDEKQSIYSFPGRRTRRGSARSAAPSGNEPRRSALDLARGAAHPLVPLDRADPQSRRPRVRAGACRRRADLAGGRDHPRTTPFAPAKRGWSSCGTVETEERPSPADAFEPWNEEPAGARSVDALVQAHRHRDQSLARQRRTASRAKAATVRAGDILILVRRRDPFTTPMIRELKRLGVPVAGADRMKLTDQLAVQDLVALADVLLMPEDDLALAVVLKSPLFGFDDDDLFTLAHERYGLAVVGAQGQGKGRAALRRSRATDSRAWLARADFLPPYEFFSELLGADGPAPAQEPC